MAGKKKTALEPCKCSKNDLVQEREGYSLPKVILGILFLCSRMTSGKLRLLCPVSVLRSFSSMKNNFENDLMKGHEGFSLSEVILGITFLCFRMTSEHF